jgi:hypothetical protein
MRAQSRTRTAPYDEANFLLWAISLAIVVCTFIAIAQ